MRPSLHSGHRPHLRLRSRRRGCTARRTDLCVACLIPRTRSDLRRNSGQRSRGGWAKREGGRVRVSSVASVKRFAVRATRQRPGSRSWGDQPKGPTDPLKVRAKILAAPAPILRPHRLIAHSTLGQVGARPQGRSRAGARGSNGVRPLLCRRSRGNGHSGRKRPESNKPEHTTHRLSLAQTGAARVTGRGRPMLHQQMAEAT